MKTIFACAGKARDLCSSALELFIVRLGHLKRTVVAESDNETHIDTVVGRRCGVNSAGACTRPSGAATTLSKSELVRVRFFSHGEGFSFSSSDKKSPQPNSARLWGVSERRRQVALKIQKAAPEYTNAAVNEIEILRHIQRAAEVRLARSLARRRREGISFFFSRSFLSS